MELDPRPNNNNNANRNVVEVSAVQKRVKLSRSGKQPAAVECAVPRETKLDQEIEILMNAEVYRHITKENQKFSIEQTPMLKRTNERMLEHMAMWKTATDDQIKNFYNSLKEHGVTDQTMRINLVHQRPRHAFHLFLHDPNLQDVYQEILDDCNANFPIVRNGKEHQFYSRAFELDKGAVRVQMEIDEQQEEETEMNEEQTDMNQDGLEYENTEEINNETQEQQTEEIQEQEQGEQEEQTEFVNEENNETQEQELVDETYSKDDEGGGDE